MGWTGKLRRALQQPKAKAQNWIQQKHEERVYQKFRMLGLAQQCMCCKHFVYREEKPRNWVCRCPDEKLRFRGTICLGWEYGEHPNMQVMRTR